jgi:hypothetical protein
MPKRTRVANVSQSHRRLDMVVTPVAPAGRSLAPGGQMIQSSPGGGSLSRPSSQRTESSLPPEQGHWKVNSTSSTTPDTSPVPPQNEQGLFTRMQFISLLPWSPLWLVMSHPFLNLQQQPRHNPVRKVRAIRAKTSRFMNIFVAVLPCKSKKAANQDRPMASHSFLC